jgi:hypothetical protein
MKCGRCAAEADELRFRCWFCGKNLCSECAETDGTCRIHPEAEGLSDQEIVARVRERSRGN